MSIYYSPEIVKLVMEERLREARESDARCQEPEAEGPRASLADSLRNLFRQSPAACTC